MKNNNSFISKKDISDKMYDRILQKQAEKKFTNADLARACNVSDSDVYNWMTRHTISPQLLYVLHHTYDIDLNYIVCGHSGEINESDIADLKKANSMISDFLNKFS